MKLLGSIFDKLVSVGVVALIILFQDEIRRFLLTLGSHQHASALVRFFTGNKKENMQHDEIMPVVMACISMGKQKVGALIVIEHNFPLDDVVRTGEVINADINQRLIENIFFKNSPLHDGAMIISKGRIKQRDVFCRYRTIWTYRRNWDCDIVQRWVSLRNPMHWLLSFPKRLVPFP
jgi:DNA integrity scanning protein DisA with diadenylate cyclase activity